MKQEELEKTLELHEKWLNNEKGGVIADLFQQDLTDANLSGYDLRYADLRYAELTNADLSGSNLSFAKLYSTYLTNADLSGSNLFGADLCFADLRFADLRWANLSGCKIDNITYNEYTSFFALQCPEEGAFIGYKKVNNIIIKLEIPEDAKRSSGTSRQCRCSKAKVLEFYDLDKNKLDIKEIVNYNHNKTIYHKDEIVYPDSFDEDRWKECSHGIHFFITFDEAKNY